MIEGGSAGGSATAQAAERRAHAQRLLHEAARLEAVASDEQMMAGQLENLPAGCAILHDLTLPDGRGRVDHVVVGPGGSFLVLTRRVDHPLSFEHGQLLVGATTMKPLFDGARVEAQALTQALGTAVVPIIGVIGSPVPPTCPAAIEGVLICPAESVAGVIARGSHTQLTAERIVEIAGKAVPLLTVAGTRARSTSVPTLAAPPPPPPSGTPAAGVPRVAAPAPSTADAPKRTGSAARDPHTARARKFLIAAIVSACLVAFAAGTLLRVLFVDDPASGSSASLVSPVPSTTLVAPTLADVTTLPASAPPANIPAPAVAFVPVCQKPGSGWSLVPSWPGDVVGLAKYDVEVLGADGKWVVVTSFANADTAAAAIVGQQPNSTVTVQIVAVLADGSRSPGTSTPIITPATAC
jgi:hypothetical protein